MKTEIEPMKLAEIYNKAMNRCYELFVVDAVCEKMFGQTLHAISSRAARQKYLRKNIQNSNREEARKHAIERILELIHDEGDMTQTRFTCKAVISNIAD